jgi:WD40 repeat protein
MASRALYTVGGTVQASEGGVYIPRRADEEMLRLCQEGTFAYVLSTRQVGKSSLLVRTAERLGSRDVRTVVLDLTQWGSRASAEEWYLGLLVAVTDQLSLEADPVGWWKEHAGLGMVQRWTLFFEKVLLSEVTGRVVIFMDEIETTLALDFTDDFFAAIRYLYNARAENPELRRLSFVLSGVASPSDLIRDPQRTPFNIGRRVELTDFTLAEALPLAAGLGLEPKQAEKVLGWVFGWTGGHPYLTQRLCSDLASQNRADWSEVDVECEVTRLFFQEQSGQDDNLRFVREMLTRRAPDLERVLATYRSVYRGRSPVVDEERSVVKSHLKLAGVVRTEQGVLHVRNAIYRKVFDEEWIRKHWPVNWSRRLQRAVSVLVVAVYLLCLPLALTAWVQHNQAKEERQLARKDREALRKLQREVKSRELAVGSRELSRQDVELSVLVATEAVTVFATVQAREALTQSLLLCYRRAAMRGHGDAVTSAAFSLDGKRVVTGSLDKTARLWDVYTGKPIGQPLAHEAAVMTVAFSPDGAWVVTGSLDGMVRLWDTSDPGKPAAVLRGQKRDLSWAAFSPDVRRVVTTGSYATALVWDLAMPQREPVALKGHTGVVVGAAFSPDGAWVVTYGSDGTARLWDARAGGQIALLRHDDWVYGAAFSPDGQLIVTASGDKLARLWEAKTGDQRGVFIGHTGAVNSVAVSQDGRRVLTASKDQTARLWDVSTGRCLQTLEHTGRLYSAALSPDGRLVATASEGTGAALWDAATGRRMPLLGEHDGSVSGVKFGRNGKLLLMWGGAYPKGTAEIYPCVLSAETYDVDALRELAREQVPRELTPEERDKYVGELPQE